MRQTEKPKDSKCPKNKVFFRGGFWWIVLGASVLSGVVIRLSWVFESQTSQYTFIAQGVLNILIFAAILVQALIYRRQWDAMTDTLGETRQVVIQNERLAVAAEASAKAAQESTHLMAQSQRPDITLGLKFGVLEVGKPIPFEFEVFNAGKETAYNFGIHISCDWKPVGFDGVLDYGKPKHEAAEPIRPQARKYVHPQWFYPLQPHELFTLINGTVWLFVYGILWYEDGTGRRYDEPFCRRFDRGSPNDAVECPYSIRERMVEEPNQAAE